MTKVCFKCKVEKDKSEFYKKTAAKGGLSPYCITCCKEKHKRWRDNNPGKISSFVRQHGMTKKEYQKQTGLKFCPDCKNLKSISEFPYAKGKWDGLYNYCKLCTNKQMRDKRKENPDMFRNQELKKKYGITLDQ